MRKNRDSIARASPRAVRRVTDILELLARRRMGLSFSDIARQVGVPKASLSDLLTGLSSGEFLYRDGNGHYFLGPKALALARLMVSSGRFVNLAHPLIEELSRRSGETALIGCLDEQSMKTVYIDKAECGNPIRYTATLGLKRELYATAIGKVLLAHFPRARLETFLRTVALESFTPRTLVERASSASQFEQSTRDRRSRDRGRADYGRQRGRRADYRSWRSCGRRDWRGRPHRPYASRARKSGYVGN